MSGLIFVALAAVWAVVLIPMALRHHDEAARTRAVDNFSDDLRVVARREAVSSRESRLVVPSRLRRTPSAEAPVADATPQASPTTPFTSSADAAVAVSSAVPAPRRSGPRDGRPAAPVRAVPAQRRASARRAHRAAARAAARRRRVVLALLLLVTLGVSVGSLTGALQAWAPAVPAAVVVGFLVLARVLARREQRAWHAVVAPGDADETTQAPTAPAAPLVVADLPRFAPGITVPVVPPVSVISGLDDTAGLPVGLTGLAPSTSVEGLWDPLPVTLPTYVTKPRAHRSVRTIDLLEPGVVSSGRNAADSALVAEAATAMPQPVEQHRDRAVGS